MQASAAITPAVVTAWLLLAGTGWAFLLGAAPSPGPVRDPPIVRPAPAATPAASGPRRPLLVLAADPSSPQLPATFDGITAALSDDAPVELCVLLRSEADADAAALVRRGLPPGTVVDDPAGAHAARLGADSGQVSLFAADGRLLFRGELSTADGAAVDAAAVGALRAALRHRAPQRGDQDPGEAGAPAPRTVR